MTSYDVKLRDRWQTPLQLYSLLESIYTFDVDAAADETNTKCEKWFGPNSPLLEDALHCEPGEWLLHGSSFFLNPPLSKEGGPLKAWITQAYAASLHGALVCCVLPATPATEWYQIFAPLGSRYLLRSRVAFEPPPGVKPSGPRHDTFILTFNGLLPPGIWL